MIMDTNGGGEEPHQQRSQSSRRHPKLKEMELRVDQYVKKDCVDTQ